MIDEGGGAGFDDNVVNFDRAAREALSGRQRLDEQRDVKRALRELKPGADFMGVSSGGWNPDGLGMPPHCPVVPLGAAENTCVILTAKGTLEYLTAGTQKKSCLVLAFGEYVSYLHWAWPRWNAKANEGKGGWDARTFDAEACFQDLARACAILMRRNGAWDEPAMLRGRGCWRDDEGSLLLHLGDRLVLADGEERPVGVYQHFFYAQMPPVPAPVSHMPRGDEGGPGRMLLDHLSTWNWQRPEVDPMLMLGWIGQAYLSGALDWRSVVWLVGGAGVGKTTLLDLSRDLLCRLGQKTDNATAASIYRNLRNDAGGVIIDEGEGGADERRMKALVELAREAASGAVVQRAGGPNGSVQSFPVSASFLFAAIQPPSLEAADYTRTALLELRELRDQGQGLGDWADPAFVTEVGRALFKRVTARFPKVLETIGLYRDALVKAGHERRGGDAFGTLLACAHVLLDDEDPEQADLDHWASVLAPEKLQELDLASKNWSDCLDILLGATPSVWRNLEDKSVGAMLNRWREDRLMQSEMSETDEDALQKLHRRLNQVGLGLLRPGRSASYTDAMLFVPSIAAAQKELTVGTQYHGRGRVVSALKQMPPDFFERGVTGRLDGVSKKGIGIYLQKVLPSDEHNS